MFIVTFVPKAGGFNGAKEIVGREGGCWCRGAL